MTTDHIKQFALSYFPDEEASRIEWIDDTSANIVYSSNEVGLRALTALTQLGEEDISALPALRLRTAKTCLSHPESVLQVRSAVKTDRKKPRAHEASRFYLMHPEHDPRERLRHELAEKRRQGGRRDESDGDYRRLRFDEVHHVGEAPRTLARARAQEAQQMREPVDLFEQQIGALGIVRIVL